MSIRSLILSGLLLAVSLSARAEGFSVSLPTLQANGWLTQDQVLSGFGCEGKNRSPALAWRNVPAGTKSLAVTVYDPDAPTGSGWWHWVVINLPAASSGLPENAGNGAAPLLPTDVLQVNTDFGQPGFGGACPPVGHKPHRYIFTVYALSTDKIDLPKGATAAMAGYFIHANLLEKASVTALYGR